MAFSTATKFLLCGLCEKIYTYWIVCISYYPTARVWCIYKIKTIFYSSRKQHWQSRPLIRGALCSTPVVLSDNSLCQGNTIYSKHLIRLLLSRSQFKVTSLTNCAQFAPPWSSYGPLMQIGFICLFCEPQFEARHKLALPKIVITYSYCLKTNEHFACQK